MTDSEQEALTMEKISDAMTPEMSTKLAAEADVALTPQSIFHNRRVSVDNGRALGTLA